MSDMLKFPRRLVLQDAEVTNQRLDIRVSEFLGERRHFTFDAPFDEGGDPGIAFGEVVEAGARGIAAAVTALLFQLARQSWTARTSFSEL